MDYVRVYEKSTEEQSTAIRIEAEDFSAMSGVQTEDCQEGGQNVGWIDGGDWLSFDNINIPSAGTYTVSYRVASQSNSGSFNLEGDAGATNYGNVNVNASNSNGWQDWKTVTHTVNLNAGVQSFGIGIIQGGFNFNWFEIKSAANNARSIQGNELNTVQLIESTPVSIYPNPSSDNITIDGLSDRFNQLSILGVDGKVQRVIDLTESPYIQVDVSSFKPGIFIIRLSGDNTQEIYRFVKR
ncbi:MAG: carbohydrate-binding protein [Reichenbachiella sp.]